MGASILDDIKNNAIEELHLSNVPEDYFGTAEEFADAMKVNTSIQTVIFDQDFLGCTAAKERAIIVSSVGHLPNIQKVVLKDSLLMVGVCVTNLLKNAKQLHELSLENCTLQGVPSDFDMLQGALGEKAGTLKSLHITTCHAPHADVDMGKVLSTLQDQGLSMEIVVVDEDAAPKQ